MSILIKGRSLPKDGEHYLIQINADGTIYDAVGRRVVGVAVELPPHGRLIDADALIVDLMDRGVEGLQTDEWHEIQQAVEDAPIIIEAEEGVT